MQIGAETLRRFISSMVMLALLRSVRSKNDFTKPSSLSYICSNPAFSATWIIARLVCITTASIASSPSDLACWISSRKSLPPNPSPENDWQTTFEMIRTRLLGNAKSNGILTLILVSYQHWKLGNVPPMFFGQPCCCYNFASAGALVQNHQGNISIIVNVTNSDEPIVGYSVITIIWRGVRNKNYVECGLYHFQ